MNVLAKMLRRQEHREFEIRWSDSNEMKFAAALLRENRRDGPKLRGIFEIMDGGPVTYATYSNSDLRNA